MKSAKINVDRIRIRVRGGAPQPRALGQAVADRLLPELVAARGLRSAETIQVTHKGSADPAQIAAAVMEALKRR